MSAYGYEASFTIEHDNTLKKSIDCKDCIYYDKSDKSCMKTPRYLPEDGYNSWRFCGFLELDAHTSHYEEKLAQYIKWSKTKAAKEAAESKKRFNNSNTTTSNKKPKHIKSNVSSAEKILSTAECKSLKLVELHEKNYRSISKPRFFKTLFIYSDEGAKTKVRVCISNNHAYILVDKLTTDCLIEIHRLFDKKSSSISSSNNVYYEKTAGKSSEGDTLRVIVARRYKPKEIHVLFIGTPSTDDIRNIENYGMKYSKDTSSWKMPYTLEDYYSIKDLFRLYRKGTLSKDLCDKGFHV